MPAIGRMSDLPAARAVAALAATRSVFHVTAESLLLSLSVCLDHRVSHPVVGLHYRRLRLCRNPQHSVVTNQETGLSRPAPFWIHLFDFAMRVVNGMIDRQARPRRRILGS